MVQKADRGFFGGMAQAEVRAPSFVGGDTLIMGDLSGAGEIRIDGEVGGNVVARSVTVGDGGSVGGSVFAETAHIGGVVMGRVEAVTVTIAATGRVVGSVTHNVLSVESGAVLEGRRPWRPVSYLEERRKW